LLSDPAAPPELAAAFVDWVLAAQADELVASGLDGPLPADTTLIGRSVAEPAPYVDLDALRRRGVAYIDTLSANTRYQLRRAQRDYSADGALVLRAAESRTEAEAFLARLADLHQRHWTARGRPGAFASPFFARFHHAVIEAGFERGAIQLLRVTAGLRDIGYLYNLVCGRRIAAYQSGFAYQPDNRLKPGLVSHALAIEHNLAAGASRYDFLAGMNQMKQSLATHCETLNWVSLRRPRFGALLEDRARYLKSFLNKSNG
jgi:CelD/BcsL family acetyltransferase involved in cellulose biosynthesis